ncbi:hypothetical protein BDL97_14G031300 [Sphagnum fallax]|nr:hypothetical protein BDL97_14G031300 [Sphagnum fallax]KAH8941308.1 hypothetical protein BDL97_14G031300 [Sphagnum fallax]
MGSPNNSRHGKCILELKKAKNLRASKILGGKTKIHAVMRFQALSHTTKTIIDMGNNPVWEQEIFTLDITGCSDDTPVKIDIFKDGSKLIGSIVLTVLELCMVEGIPQPRNLPLVTARGKHHNEEVEILTTYLGVPNSYAPTAAMFSCPSPARGYYQATAPVWGLPYVSSMSSTSGIYQQSHSNQFQENHQSKVDLSDSEPQYPQLSQQRPSKPSLDQFYAYFG